MKKRYNTMAGKKANLITDHKNRSTYLPYFLISATIPMRKVVKLLALIAMTMAMIGPTIKHRKTKQSNKNRKKNRTRKTMCGIIPPMASISRFFLKIYRRILIFQTLLLSTHREIIYFCVLQK